MLRAGGLSDKGLSDNATPAMKDCFEQRCWSAFFTFVNTPTNNHMYGNVAGIPPHIDTPPAFEERLVSVSLGSQVCTVFFSLVFVCILLPSARKAVEILL